MLFYSNLLNEFEGSIMILSKVSNEGIKIYDQVKLVLCNSKKENIPLIGNPYLRLQNQIIEFNYLLNQHILNCQVYEDLLEDEVQIDQLLIQQIKGLLNLSQSFSERLKEIQLEIKNVKFFSNHLFLPSAVNLSASI